VWYLVVVGVAGIVLSCGVAIWYMARSAVPRHLWHPITAKDRVPRWAKLANVASLVVLGVGVIGLLGERYGWLVVLMCLAAGCFTLYCFHRVWRAFWRVRQHRLIQQLMKVVSSLTLGVYAELKDRLESRYCHMPEEDYGVMCATVTNELMMEEQQEKALAFRQTYGELVDSEAADALQDPEILAAVALALRIKGMMLTLVQPSEGVTYLERAHEIDPTGHVPTAREMEPFLRDV